VRALIFILATAAYLLLSYFIFLIALLQCGLGPDSSPTCNARVDAQLPFVIPILAVIYIAGAAGYWRFRAKGSR